MDDIDDTIHQLLDGIPDGQEVSGGSIVLDLCLLGGLVLFGICWLSA